MKFLRSLLRPTWWELRRRVQPRGRAVKLNGVVTIMADPAFNAGGGAMNYEAQYFRRFVKFLRPTDVVFDVGANQGQYSIPAGLRVGAAGRVYAFEPAPAALDILFRQIALNGLGDVVLPVSSLVADRASVAMDFHVGATAVGWSSAAYQPAGTRRLLAPAVSLDEFSEARQQAPQTIKIDVEGLEIDVLKGAEGLLRRHSPRVFCAVHPEFLLKQGKSSATLLDMMRRWGYRGYAANGKRANAATEEVIFLKGDPVP